MSRVFITFLVFTFSDATMDVNKPCCKSFAVSTCRHSNMWWGLSNAHTWNHCVKSRGETHSFKWKDALWRIFTCFWHNLLSQSIKRRFQNSSFPSDFCWAENMSECLPAHHVRNSANCKEKRGSCNKLRTAQKKKNTVRQISKKYNWIWQIITAANFVRSSSH